MHTPSETSSADVDVELVGILLDHSREVALKKAGEAEARVDEIHNFQHEEIVTILGDAPITQPIVDAVGVHIAQQHDETMSAIADTPDAIVFVRDDEMAAYQKDGSKEVGIGDDAFLDLEDATVRSRHEAEHVVQEDGDCTIGILSTGDAVIDSKSELSRRDSREDGAMRAQGGVSEDQTSEYKAIVKREDAIEAYLTRAGEDGARLREEAALTNEGFKKMHSALIQATIRNRMGALATAV